ncbi:MAG: glycosyltransferase family 9 protein [Selenomonadaceae bacterium]|nr:glycosyltransferase family 9 protein [Selenomonadaceae bacterium]
MQKIFVAKQGGIGDVLLATPVLAEIKKRLPDCHITLMIFDNARDLVEGLPFIDEVFCYNKKRDGFLKLWRKLWGTDTAIFLDLTYRPAMAAALAGVKKRVGITHKRGFWLTKKIPWQERMDHIYEPYVLAEIAEKALGFSIPKENLEKPFIVAATQQEKRDLQAKLEENGYQKGANYVASSPVTAFFLKNWPLDRWNELYRQIYARYGLKTVIFGGGELDFTWDNEAVINLWGRLTLRQVGELIKGAQLLVNSCSMPAHIAAATATPCVILYGYGDPERWAPRQNCRRVVTPLTCSPCDGYRGSRCTDPQCMKQMRVAEMFAAVQAMLGDAS